MKKEKTEDYVIVDISWEDIQYILSQPDPSFVTDEKLFTELKNPSDRVIDMINETSPNIKINKEYKNKSIF